MNAEKQIRNIAIIAHVDHGKTTLTDALLKFAGAVKEGSTMDSNALEQERGITIYAKNASIEYKGGRINIVDTPGHADFGSEVERVLRSIDTVLLVVDAQEGPMPQTRFVLKKSLELGHKPIVVINKIDKKAARPDEVHDEVLELFMELGATDEQLDFPVVYAIGRDGVAMLNVSDEQKDLSPLLDVVTEHVVGHTPTPKEEFVAQVFNLAYDDFLGRIAVARVYKGTLATKDSVFAIRDGAETRKGKVSKLYSFIGVTRCEIDSATSGDIVLIAGIPDVYIGDTISKKEDTVPLEAIHVDEPTITMNFLVNDSPFAGQDGKFVTSRQIRERLEKELEVNVGLKVTLDDVKNDSFEVKGRGELHIAILLENMRREGYELQISRPTVITKIVDGHKMEPFEEVIIDVPDEFSGAIIGTLSERKAMLKDSKEHDGRTRLIFDSPTRALLGYKNKFTIDTRGEGILSSRFIEFRQHVGDIKRSHYGSMISGESGKVVAYSLENLQQRGTLYLEPGEEVYAGMVVGNVTKGDDLTVNPVKGKNLTNMRSKSSDGIVELSPAIPITIERGMEVMSEDEYLEITPHFVRLRKKYLTEQDRIKSLRVVKK